LSEEALLGGQEYVVYHVSGLVLHQVQSHERLLLLLACVLGRLREVLAVLLIVFDDICLEELVTAESFIGVLSRYES